MIQQQEFIDYLRNTSTPSFESYLGWMCVINGHFDLAFEFLKDYPEKLIFFFSSLENRSALFDTFKSNHLLAFQYKRILVELTNIEIPPCRNIIKWLGEGIVYN